MPMVGSDLADFIKSNMGFDQYPMSNQLAGISNDIVNHLKTGTVSNLPGTVTGTAPPTGGLLGSSLPPVPGPDGAATNGVIVLVPADLQGRFVATFGQSTPQILALATTLSSFFITGVADFAKGNITGNCTNVAVPAPAPGPLLLGMGVNGTIKSLVSSTLASNLAAAFGQPSSNPKLDGLAAAITDYVSNNATLAYAIGSVVAICPAGGGPITLGAATGGTIT